MCEEHISISISGDFTETETDFITLHMFQVLSSAADQIVPLSCKRKTPNPQGSEKYHTGGNWQWKLKLLHIKKDLSKRDQYRL